MADRAGVRLRSNHKRRPIWPHTAIVLGFLIWAGAFISRTAVLAQDGRVYFSLFDDAMIALRYAWNFAHGEGLVWNPGEPIEGYTSLLMVLVMAPISALVGDKRLTVLAVQVLGIPTLLATAALARAAYRHATDAMDAGDVEGREPWVLAGTLFYYPLAFLTLMGMETGLVAVLLLAAVVLAFRCADRRTVPGFTALGLVLGLGYLARPDTLISSLIIVLWIGSALASSPRGGRRALGPAIAAGILAAFVAGQALFRSAYYGEVLPNTYLLKVEGFPLSERLDNGIAYLRPFLAQGLPLAALAGAALAFNYSSKRLLIVGIFLSAGAYTIYVGGDAWRNWRFIAPTIPLLVGVAVEEASRITRAISASLTTDLPTGYFAANPIWRPLPSWDLWIRLKARLSSVRPTLLAGVGLVLFGAGADLIGVSGAGFGEEQIALILLGVLLLVVPALRLRVGERTAHRLGPAGSWATAAIVLGSLVVANHNFLPELFFRRPPFTVDFNEKNIRRAVAIRRITTSRASVGVAAAGVVPYYTGLRSVDFLGKSDARIARLPADISGAMATGSILAWPGHNKYDLDYSISELRPTSVQLLRWGSDDLCHLLGDIYVPVDIDGVRLFLLKDSADVDWDRVREEGTFPVPEEACSTVLD